MGSVGLFNSPVGSEPHSCPHRFLGRAEPEKPCAPHSAGHKRGSQKTKSPTNGIRALAVPATRALIEKRPGDIPFPESRVRHQA